MSFKLNKRQQDLLYSHSYSEFENFGLHKSSVTFLRKKISHMKIGTLEKVLKKVWNISLKDFFSLE